MADSEVLKPGSPPAMPAIDGDIGQLRDVEGHHLWEQTFDAVSDPISIVDENYRVIAANAAYRRMFGLLPGAMSPHQCFSDHGGGGPCEGCPLDATIRSGVPHMFRQERLAKAADGNSPRWERRVYHRWTYPILNEDDSVHRVVEILRDVTEQERLRELTTEAEALRRADKLKTELLGSVSHELRSPLTTIKGYAETLARHERRLSREERQEFLSAISQASDRLGDVIERLLLLSRLESGDDSPEPTPVDMGRVAQEAALGLREEEQSRISVTITGSPDTGRELLPPLALGDPRLLREALDALIDNALKYTQDDGRIDIEVRTTYVPASGIPGMGSLGEEEVRPSSPPRLPSAGQTKRCIEVIVRDDGQGIPHESQPYIFDAFHRVETGLTRAVEGLGLGLAICKRIITQSHGRLWVESALGAGSAFHILLPAYESEEPYEPDELGSSGT
jgi:signal transduction histidine kinase